MVFRVDREDGRAVLAFARANRLDRQVWPSPAARLGIVSTGKSWLDVLQALEDLGIDRDKAARYGLNVGDVQDTVAVAVGGRQAGTLYEGDRRFDMVVRLSDAMRQDVDGLSKLLIPVPALLNGNANSIGFIALSEVASLDLQLGPNQVSRENGKRLVIVSANVRGRDIGSFVAEAGEVIELTRDQLLAVDVVAEQVEADAATTAYQRPERADHQRGIGGMPAGQAVVSFDAPDNAHHVAKNGRRAWKVDP